MCFAAVFIRIYGLPPVFQKSRFSSAPPIHPFYFTVHTPLSSTTISNRCFSRCPPNFPECVRKYPGRLFEQQAKEHDHRDLKARRKAQSLTGSLELMGSRPHTRFIKRYSASNSFALSTERPPIWSNMLDLSII